MDTESLHHLGIAWKGAPKFWHTIPLSLLPTCCIRGIVRSPEGEVLFTLRPKEELGKGSYGRIDAFYKKGPIDESVVAVKRPRGDGNS
jgi:hypothetical protein